MLTLLQGDDTAANNRSIRLIMPDVDVGTGYTLEFILGGLVRSGAYVKGGELRFNYTAAETLTLPLGLSYARLCLVKGGLRESITTNLPVCVTDCIERVKMATNTITLNITVNPSVPHVPNPPLTPESTPAEVKDLANALRAAINSTPAT